MRSRGRRWPSADPGAMPRDYPIHEKTPGRRPGVSRPHAGTRSGDPTGAADPGAVPRGPLTFTAPLGPYQCARRAFFGGPPAAIGYRSSPVSVVSSRRALAPLRPRRMAAVALASRALAAGDLATAAQIGRAHV